MNKQLPQCLDYFLNMNHSTDWFFYQDLKFFVLIYLFIFFVYEANMEEGTKNKTNLDPSP